MKRLATCIIAIVLCSALILTGCGKTEYVNQTILSISTELITTTVTPPTVTSTVTTTVTGSQHTPPITSSVVDNPTSATELAQYLSANFGTCNTSVGSTSFTFEIQENTSISIPFDYWIKVKFDPLFFFNIKDSNQISTEMNHTVCNELKAFQQSIALAAMAKMPGKKMYGQYFISGYRYPSIREGYWSHRYYTWSNYTPGGGLGSYNDAHITGFTWYETLDDVLWR